MVRKRCTSAPLFPCRVVNLELNTGKMQSSKTVPLKTPSPELIIFSHAQFCNVNDFPCIFFRHLFKLKCIVSLRVSKCRTDNSTSTTWLYSSSAF